MKGDEIVMLAMGVVCPPANFCGTDDGAETN